MTCCQHLLTLCHLFISTTFSETMLLLTAELANAERYLQLQFKLFGYSSYKKLYTQELPRPPSLFVVILNILF